MKTVEIDEETFRRLALAARLTGASVSEVVARLTEGDDGACNQTKDKAPAPQPPGAGEVAVHVVYKGERFEGFFDPASARIRITAGSLAGRSFRSPSSAAVAVVRTVNPDRQNPETNGWTFWTETSTGKLISRLRMG